MASAGMCMSCHEDLPDDGKVMTCNECSNPYHVGSCSGIAESAYKSKGEAGRRSWRCATCKTRTLGGGQERRQKKTQELDVASLLLAINAKLDSLSPLRESVDKIEQAIQTLSGKYDEVLEKLDRQDGQIKDLKKRVTKMESSESSNQIKLLKEEINELEWRGRRQNLEIHGLPAEPNEDLLTKVNEVAKKLELPELHDIDAAMHRLPARPNKTPGIVVRFTRQALRDKWLDSRRKLKRSETTVHILENLTKHNRALLWSARQWARNKQYRYVWHRDGKVFVRRSDGERAFLIKCEEDLLTLS